MSARTDVTTAPACTWWFGRRHRTQAIRGARVTTNGAVLDPGGFNISGGGVDVDAIVEGESANTHGIASVGSQWFVLLEGAEVVGAHYHFHTEGARVDGDGNVLDLPHLEVATSVATDIGHGIRWNTLPVRLRRSARRTPPSKMMWRAAGGDLGHAFVECVLVESEQGEAREPAATVCRDQRGMPQPTGDDMRRETLYPVGSARGLQIVEQERLGLHAGTGAMIRWKCVRRFTPGIPQAKYNRAT